MNLLRKLKELEPRDYSRKLYQLIYDKILIPGATNAEKTDYQEGIELFGEILMIHREFKEKNPWGDLFGEFMCEYERLSGKWGGQFLTPINICDMMVGRLDPDMKEFQRILDPAAGTGRFMLRTAKHYAEKAGQYNFLFTNIDIDQRVFVFCTMNAILYDIPSVNIRGDTLATKFWDAFMTIPTNIGIAQWARVDPKLLEEQFNQMFEDSRPKRGLEEFIGKVKAHRPRKAVSKVIVKPEQKTLFE